MKIKDNRANCLSQREVQLLEVQLRCKFEISDILLRIETTMRQRRLRSKIEAKFRTIDPP